MRNRLALISLTACLGASSLALAAPSFTYGPIVGRGETPDKMIVKWGTSSSGASSLYWRKVGDPTWSTATGNTSADHEVLLTGLSTATSYEYAFDNSGIGYAQMATCPAPGSPMDVVFYGDNRPPFLGTSQHPQVIAAVAATMPDLVMNSGDLSFGGTAAEMQSGVLQQIATLAKSTPYMSAPGNHETTVGYSGNFDRFFPTPRPDGTAWRSYYAFVCGNAMFIVLDSNAVSDAAQAAFLTDKLAAADADASIDHIFVNFHHAPYSVGTHGDTANVQSSWVPLFDAATKLKAVFSGHDHLYGRFSNGSHVAYIVSGGAGADLYDDGGSSSAMKVVSKKVYNFVSVHVAGKSVSFKTSDLNGTTIDSLDVGPPPPPDMAGQPGDDAGTTTGDDGGSAMNGADMGTSPFHIQDGGCSYGGGGAAGAPAVLAGLLVLLALRRRRA